MLRCEKQSRLKIVNFTILCIDYPLKSLDFLCSLIPLFHHCLEFISQPFNLLLCLFIGIWEWPFVRRDTSIHGFTVSP